ncbi:MAG: hypothetical protein R1F54_03490 [Candidatus Zeuxoniibacter abyssi]|nr:MAG: hypothetical protein R1F54_03490 [Candidatus Persebacteraceae bacterium AB1(2)]
MVFTPAISKRISATSNPCPHNCASRVYLIGRQKEAATSGFCQRQPAQLNHSPAG